MSESKTTMSFAFVATLLLLMVAPAASAQVLVPFGADWRYLDDGSNLGTTDWFTDLQDDSNWAEGPGQLGVGGNDEATVIDCGGTSGCPTNSYITTYFRHRFQVGDPSQFSALQLQVIRQDGVRIFLNGQEVFEDNLRPCNPGVIDFSDHACELLESGEENEVLTAFVPGSHLVPGENLLAAEVHRAQDSDADAVSFDLKLASVAIASDAIWQYFDEGYDPGLFWNNPNVYVLWPSGPGPLGFGPTMNVTTEINDAGSVPHLDYAQVYYFRRKFQVEDPSLISALTLNLSFNDAIRVYLNGTEVHRSHLADANPTHDSLVYINYGQLANIWDETVSINSGLLVPGDNLLAVAVHQSYIDMWNAYELNPGYQPNLYLDVSLVPEFRELPVVVESDPELGRRISYQGQLDGVAGATDLQFRLVNSADEVVWGPEAQTVLVESSGVFAALVGASELDLCTRDEGTLDCVEASDGVADLDQVDFASDSHRVQVALGDGAFSPVGPELELVPAFHAARAGSVEPGVVEMPTLDDEVLENLVPTGFVMPFAGSLAALPPGWLLCDGRVLDQSSHPGLFSVIGTSHGGSGNRFHLPDYHGRFLRGVDHGSGRDEEASSRDEMNADGNSGDAIGSVQREAIVDHEHVSSHHHDMTTYLRPTNDLSEVMNFALGDGAAAAWEGWLHSSWSFPAPGEPASPSFVDVHNHDGMKLEEASIPEAKETRIANASVYWIIRCGPQDSCL